MKTLEKRKAEALEVFPSSMYEAASYLIDHGDLIAELLQPSPTDDEVAESLLSMRSAINMCPQRVQGSFAKAYNVIRRATTPKPCDKLVKALDHIKQLAKLVQDRHISSIAEQALADHKGNS